jgi:hypothetical protein
VTRKFAVSLIDATSIFEMFVAIVLVREYFATTSALIAVTSGVVYKIANSSVTQGHVVMPTIRITDKTHFGKVKYRLF